jgi:hypothetical protein
VSDQKQYKAGEIPYFDEYLPHLLKWAEFLISTDELALAQELLTKGMPGFYRDNVPEEVKRLRQELFRFLMNSEDYAKNWQDLALVDAERSKGIVTSVLRGKLILKDVEELNEKGKTPHIIEMGPGEYWLPVGLHAHGCKFTYHGIGLHGEAQTKAKTLMGDSWRERIPGEPVIFAACELLEHLWNPYEIPQTLAKTGHEADIVHLSTPLYTFGFGKLDWRDPKFDGQGGHLKTYTPQEFMSIAQDLFPGYSLIYYHSQIMSIRGNKDG